MSATDLSPLSSPLRVGGPLPAQDGPSAVRSRARAPRGFHPPGRSFHSVRFGGTVPHARSARGAKGAGLRYEQRVHDVLSAIYNEAYWPHPAMLYQDETGLRRAIPDGVLKSGKGIILIEVKYTHCELAWWQLNKLYLPLLTHVYKVPITCVEICHSYDPEVQFPVSHVLVTSIHKVPQGITGVMQWKI